MHQPHKIVKNTQIIRRQESTNCLSVFDRFVALVLKGLPLQEKAKIQPCRGKNECKIRDTNKELQTNCKIFPVYPVTAARQ